MKLLFNDREPGSLTTDASGNLVSELRYSAWGETRFESGATPTTYRYTGQREEASFGLYFYQARWLDPYITHFTQADSIIPGAGDPQAWDRYAFVYNNPLKYTDPTGHKACDDEYGDCLRRPGKIIKPPQPPKQPWIYSKDVVVGFHVGPTGDIHVPNYDDDSYNGVPWVSNRNRDNNFWVRLNIRYEEYVGITLSDIRFENYSDYPVTLEGVKFESGDKSVVPRFSAYGREMPSGFGSEFAFPAPPEPFDGSSPVVITIEVGWTVSTGHGPFQIAPDQKITLPRLVDAKYFIQTGQIPQRSLWFLP